MSTQTTERLLEETWKMIEECANGTAIDERGRRSQGVTLTPEGCAAFLAERQRRGPLAQGLANVLESAARAKMKAWTEHLHRHGGALTSGTMLQSPRELFNAGWDARAALEPARAPPGTLEIGESPTSREVVMNVPHMQDNGTGWVYYTFTPQQAIDVGELLIKKARAIQT